MGFGTVGLKPQMQRADKDPLQVCVASVQKVFGFCS